MNLHRNKFSRSNSDQTTYNKKTSSTTTVVTIKAGQPENVHIYRTHSLKSDAVMSPVVTPTAAERVRRTKSATTPRSVTKKPVYRGGKDVFFAAEGTPRRSPRLQNLI